MTCIGTWQSSTTCRVRSPPKRSSGSVQRRITTGFRERYVLDAGALSSELPVLVFRPRELRNALHPVIFLPPADSYTGAYPSSEIDITRYGVEFVVRNGRALILAGNFRHSRAI